MPKLIHQVHANKLEKFIVPREINTAKKYPMAVSKILTPNKVGGAVVQDVVVGEEEAGEEDVVEGEVVNLGGSTDDNLYHTHHQYERLLPFTKLLLVFLCFFYS